MLTACGALAGCAGQGNAENDNALAVAGQFTRSVRTDPARACALLAPQTLKTVEDEGGTCATALPREVQPAIGGTSAVQVYGKDAIVHLGTSTLFLARFGLGWRVTAAGCTPQPDRPYDCTVRGS
ncbi:hypothetical protein ASC58_09515 [Phycicoccus sp. Root101]|nr:hypothetical protein ASC58_09515 [Phycicoccus sp. Root101]